MTFWSRFLSGSLPLSIAAAMLGLIASPAAAADRIMLRVEVFAMGGLHVATDRTTIEEKGNTYAITGDLQTRGLAGMFQEFQSKSAAHGRLGAMARPDAYNSDVRRDSGERHDKVDYRTGAAASGGSTPPASDGAAPTRDTVDPLTAYFLVERQLGQGGDCAMSVPVFDGRHRYNLQFTDAGEQDLAASGGQHYSGAAKACKMTRENVAGYPTDKLEMPKHGTIWYARLAPGDLLLPVKVEMATDIGSVTGHLAEMRGRGADLHFKE